MQSTSSLRLGLNIMFAIGTMASGIDSMAADTMKKKEEPPYPSTVHVALKGTADEIRQACGYLEPRLGNLQIEFRNGCKERYQGNALFIFKRDDILRNNNILGWYVEAFTEQVKQSPVPPKNLTMDISWKSCLVKVMCVDKSEKWYPCDCTQRAP